MDGAETDNYERFASIVLNGRGNFVAESSGKHGKHLLRRGECLVLS